MSRLISMRLTCIASFCPRVSVIGAVVASLGVGSLAQSQVPFYSRTELARAVAVQQANQSSLLAGDGVFGVGVGETNGALAITVLVDDASRTNQLPSSLDNVPVTVRVTGAIHAFACGGSNPQVSYPLPVPL